MLLNLLSPDVLIWIAGGAFTIGYLIINQVILRLMIAFGSIAYIAYYATVADEPLWGAIFASMIMLTANFLGLAGLYLRNALWTIPRAHRDIFPLFEPLQPGDFRRIMRKAERYKMPEDTTVTITGEPTETVYFIISGEYRVEKFGLEFMMHGPTFVGEVAHLLRRTSAATTYFPKGLEVLAWDRNALDIASRKNPQFKLALEAVMSRDLANKVAFAVAPKVG